MNYYKTRIRDDEGNTYQWSASYYSSFYKEPSKREETILGLCYGDVYNQYPEWNLRDTLSRLRLNKYQKDIVVAYLKDRYNFWKNKIK